MKWMAPEAIVHRKYTSASDVWAFAVLCWEAFSLGESPYAGLAPTQVTNFVQQGKRLPKPLLAPAAVHSQVLLPAWQIAPDMRPSFQVNQKKQRRKERKKKKKKKKKKKG